MRHTCRASSSATCRTRPTSAFGWWTAHACSSTSRASPGCPSGSPGAAAARAPSSSPTRSATCFERLLARRVRPTAAALLKFGGDALLLLFDGDRDHAERACAQRRGRCAPRLRAEHGRSRPAARRSACGCRSACTAPSTCCSLVGELAPRAADRRRPPRRGRADGEGGGRRRDRRSARRPPPRCPGRCVGAAHGARPPAARARRRSSDRRDDDRREDRRRRRSSALSTELRAHVLAGPQPPEHRDRDRRVPALRGHRRAWSPSAGPEARADALDELVALVQDVADADQVCFLGSDIDADGGKLILTAGAPRALGDEDERMLLGAAPDRRRRRRRCRCASGCHRGRAVRGRHRPAGTAAPTR